jgi:hypothetical protein
VNGVEAVAHDGDPAGIHAEVGEVAEPTAATP